MQQQVSHQMMGYDRTSTMFSPDGRLLQVEYAKKTVGLGPSAIGMVCKDGVLLLADKGFSEKLLVLTSIEKISKIDEHIAVTSSGISSDGRILIEKSQLLAQQHRVTYDTPMDILSLVKDICNLKQFYTQYGGVRPFGVALLFAAINDEPDLYVTGPTGNYFKYKATAIGEFELELKEILDKEYKDGMLCNDGLKLAMKALKKVIGKDFDLNRIEAVVIKTAVKKFVKLNSNELTKI